MPRSASTRLKDRSAFPGRPSSSSANHRAPVLFRLPAIDPMALLAGLEDISEGTRKPKPDATMSSAVPAMEPAQLAPPPAFAETSVSPTILEQAVVQPEPVKSWWEHWSSGIVLILLVIALVTASIVAFSDAGSVSDLDVVADAEQASATKVDGGDIPVVEPLAASEPAKPDTALALTVSEPAPAAVASTPEVLELGSLESGIENTVTLEPAKPVERKVAPEPKLIVSVDQDKADTGLVPSELTFPAPPTLAGSQQVAPEVKQPELLIVETTAANMDGPDPTLLVADKQVVLSPEKPPASNALLSLEPSGTAANTSRVDPSDKGVNSLQSSTLGNNTLVPQQATLQQSASQQSASQQTQNGIPDTQLPSYRELLSGQNPAQVGFSTASHVSGTSIPASTVSHPTASVSPAAPTSPGAREIVLPVESATPDMRAEAIINAYQEYRQINQAEQSSANRYMSSPAGGALKK